MSDEIDGLRAIDAERKMHSQDATERPLRDVSALANRNSALVIPDEIDVFISAP